MMNAQQTNRARCSSTTRCASDHRRGSITVLTAFMLIIFLALTAFALDIGYLALVRTELQRTADAAALAAACELATETDVPAAIPRVRSAAVTYAASNPVGRHAPVVDRNTGNDTNGDVVVGTVGDLRRGAAMFFSDPTTYNAVQVRVRRDGLQNGEVRLFFARILGCDSVAMQAVATAAITRNVVGFRPPPLSAPLPLLPIAIEHAKWQQIIADENHEDALSWDSELQNVTTGMDGIGEGCLYPTITGSPGNLGTVNIGTGTNSTSHLSQQILRGLSESDLAYHGGELRLDDQGELHLSGDPGVSSSIASELAQIKGQPRVVPIYSQVTQSGSIARYTIIGFGGVRIMDVRRRGMRMEVTVQPANVATGGTIPGGEEQRSQFVFSTPRLIQ